MTTDSTPPLGSAGAQPLAPLLAGLADVPAEVCVSDVTLDSRTVREGGLFLACRGGTRHGLEFAEQAVAQGARAILYEAGSGADALPPAVRAAAEAGRVLVASVPALAERAGTIAARFFGAPSRHLAIAGLTGTNGKTTCAYLLAQALTKCGRKAGYLGTLGSGLPGAITPLDLTTPDAVTVHRQLAALRSLGAECIGMEVSSHALEQGRVNGVRFRVAAFTNLTRDHLDFHGSMQAYGAAKARLFERELAARVINVDDPFGRELARRFTDGGSRTAGAAGRMAERLIVTSRQPMMRASAGLPGAEPVCAPDVRRLSSGSHLTIDSGHGRAELDLPLLGEFNVDNALVVLGTLLALDVPLERAAAALAECTAPPGRMEVVRGPADGPVAIVDYAHTPDGLAKALQAARAHCAGTLRVVFGCGGDRDPGKRALMGRTARELADEVIITDDNPRTEEPGRIVADILAGTRDARVRIQHDRAAAIREALDRSTAGDVVLIAGKGHEDHQIVGRERRPFSDRSVARAYLEEKGRACGAR